MHLGLQSASSVNKITIESILMKSKPYTETKVTYGVTCGIRVHFHNNTVVKKLISPFGINKE